MLRKLGMKVVPQDVTLSFLVVDVNMVTVSYGLVYEAVGV
jgi:hypothetical protein